MHVPRREVSHGVNTVVAIHRFIMYLDLDGFPKSSRNLIVQRGWPQSIHKVARLFQNFDHDYPIWYGKMSEQRIEEASCVYVFLQPEHDCET